MDYNTKRKLESVFGSEEPPAPVVDLFEKISRSAPAPDETSRDNYNRRALQYYTQLVTRVKSGQKKMGGEYAPLGEAILNKRPDMKATEEDVEDYFTEFSRGMKYVFDHFKNVSTGRPYLPRKIEPVPELPPPVPHGAAFYDSVNEFHPFKPPIQPRLPEEADTSQRTFAGSVGVNYRIGTSLYLLMKKTGTPLMLKYDTPVTAKEKAFATGVEEAYHIVQDCDEPTRAHLHAILQEPLKKLQNKYALLQQQQRSITVQAGAPVPLSTQELLQRFHEEALQTVATAWEEDALRIVHEALADYRAQGLGRDEPTGPAV